MEIVFSHRTGIRAYARMRTMQTRKIEATLQCFVKKDGKYLMLHRNARKRIMPSVWMAPGGRREFNEGLFEAARREVKEETGLDIKNIKILSTGCAYMKDIDQECFFHLLEADYAAGELHQNPEDGELVWVTVEEMGKLDNLLAEIREILPHLFNSDKIFSYKSSYDSGNNMTEFVIEEAN